MKIQSSFIGRKINTTPKSLYQYRKKYKINPILILGENTKYIILFDKIIYIKKIKGQNFNCYKF